MNHATASAPKPEVTSKTRKLGGWLLFVTGVAILCGMAVLLKLTIATDYLNHSLLKDPERTIPEGPVLVAPADGTILYVKRITDGVIEDVVKKGVPIPIEDMLKGDPERPFKSGYLVGIFMNTQGVHINRMPSGGKVTRQIVFNGPHMDMTDTEREVIVRQLIPGMVTVKKLLGVEPFVIEDNADYILGSARESLEIEDERGARIYMVRIADYWVGKILTWVAEGDTVERGQRMGMITWGSQTDLLIEDTPGLTVTVDVGEYVYGGETVVATY